MVSCARGYRLRSAAVQRGGLGDTAAALALLQRADDVARAAGDEVLASLSASTRASLLRQAGLHRDALGVDGRALRLVGGLRIDDPFGREALLDALVGLAADQLGLLRFGAVSRLLARARAGLAPDDSDWSAGRRPRLRIEWVSAELAVYTGNVAVAAQHVRAALELCDAAGTPERHRVKTLLIAAGVSAAAADADASARATLVVDRATAAGLLPLRWAALALLADLDPADGDLTADLADTRFMLVQRGVPFGTPR